MMDELYDYDICVVYNDADKAWTTKLVRSLEQVGVKVFFTLLDVQPRRTMYGQMTRALSRSRRIGLVLSPDFMESNWEEFESSSIKDVTVPNWEKHIILLLRRTTKLHPFVQGLPSIDFRDDARFEEGYRKLLAIIKNEHPPGVEQTTIPSLMSAPSASDDIEAEESLEHENSRLADEAGGERVDSHVAASQPTKFGYNPELENLLRAESSDLRPAMAEMISALLAQPFDVVTARLLETAWLSEGEREKAAVVRRHIQSLQQEVEAEQQALKALQEKRSAPTGEASAHEQTPASQTTAHEQTSTPDETDASKETPPESGYSDSFKRIVSMAKVLKRQLDKSNFDREVLLTSLFLYQEESPAFLCLSAFGIRAETLLARLWEKEGRYYPAWLTPDDLKRQAEHVFEVESGIKTAEQFADILMLDDLNAGMEMLEVLATLHAQKEAFEARHLFWALMSGDTSGWVEATLGTKQTACIKRLLTEKGVGATITRADVLAAVVQDRLFVNPPTHRDSAAKEDLLGFKDHANALVDIIEKEDTRPPLVIGVYGPWGAGKSTFMGLVKQKLDERSDERARLLAATEASQSFAGRARRAFAKPSQARRILQKPPPAPAPLKVVTIEYDAWAYADTPKLWSGLIGKVAKELDAELGWYGRFAYLLKRHSRRLTAAIVVGLVPVAIFALGLTARFLQNFAATDQAGANISNFLQQIGFSALLGGNALGKIVSVATPIASLLYALTLQKRPVTDAVTALAARFDSAPAAGIVSRIQDEFKTALETKINPAEKPETEDAKKSKIRQRVEQNQLKIVVFIDELDRCPLERIVDILEAIKLFLAEDIFIVFLGVDTRVAAEAIRLHYKDVKNPDLPREYLEKIVQLPLRVPQADEDEIKEYLGSFMPGVAPPQTKNGDGARAKVQTKKAPPPQQSSTSGSPGALPHVAGGGAADDDADGAALVVEPSAQAANATVRFRATNFPPSRYNVVTPILVPDYSAPPATDGISTLPSLPDTEDEYECIAVIAREFLESNPRRIKRLLNTYRYVKILASLAGEPVQTKVWQEEMLSWLSFTMKWPAFMEQAIEAADEAESVATRAAKTVTAQASGNGKASPRDAQHFLLILLGEENSAGDPRPNEQEIRAYLDFDAEQVRRHFALAGNFLIENPRPYADSLAAQKQTPAPQATAKNAPTPPRVRKSKNAKTEPQPQP
jgi:hypothetical protein